MNELKNDLNTIKPITASNHKVLSTFIDICENRINKNMQAGKEYVGFNIFDFKEQIEMLKKVDEDMIVNILILEKSSEINPYKLLTEEEKARYKKSILGE